MSRLLWLWHRSYGAQSEQPHKWLLGFILPEAGDQIRTGDPQLGKLMLYQLSYARDNAGI